MKTHLNIRVDFPGSASGKDNAEAKRVIDTLKAFPGLHVHSVTRIQGQVEGCLYLEHQDVIWAEVTCPEISLRCAIYVLASNLGRDCIAVYDPKTDMGALIGPRIDGYGPFDADLFLQPQGVCA